MESEREKLERLLEEGAEQLWRFPAVHVDFHMTRSAGNAGEWTGSALVNVHGEEHSVSLDHADDVSALLALKALGDYCTEVIEACDEHPAGSPSWVAGERAAAGKLEAKLRR